MKGTPLKGFVGRITPARLRVEQEFPPSCRQEYSCPSRNVVQLRLRYHNPTRERGTQSHQDVPRSRVEL